ncbi:hypothetical protein A3K73_06770 [Candidatus Pacearchaeota archaeon RBG_13_36_9]|nr:MAG: hypothetical protein A3K73_06770 [Candidatus Pacearchaeota archaeon RBG_13_36_9]
MGKDSIDVEIIRYNGEQVVSIDGDPNPKYLIFNRAPIGTPVVVGNNPLEAAEYAMKNMGVKETFTVYNRSETALYRAA